jgi:hypothetical protein
MVAGIRIFLKNGFWFIQIFPLGNLTYFFLELEYQTKTKGEGLLSWTELNSK